MFKNKKGFTLAEALTALTVLGVLAAISLPVIITNYNDHANIAAQKAMNLDLTHAMQNLIAEDGRLNKLQANANGSFGEGNYINPNEAFVKEKLVNVLKIARTCNPALNATPADSSRNCGIKQGDDYLSFDRIGNPDLNFTANGDVMLAGQFINYSITGVNLNLYPVSLANGASMFVLYYPNCADRDANTPIGNQLPNLDNVCVNIVYDVNGAKGPNQVGRDVGFFTAFYPTKTVFGAPVLYEGGLVTTNTSLVEAERDCSELAPNNKAGLPTYEEAVSIKVNGQFFEEEQWEAVGYTREPNVPLLHQKSANGANGPYICVHK